MTTNPNDSAIKEQTIFYHTGNKIITPDREIEIIERIEEPLIVVLGNVLSDEECDKLVECSKERLERSKIGTSHEVNAMRTSSGMFFDESENELITRIEKRLSFIMNIPVSHAEPLHILRYTFGQEYKPHFDYFSSLNKEIKNNRISTMVIYLNDVKKGGETSFPKLNFSVPPRKGSAVYFEYFYNDKNLNELTLHSGTPVINGEKYALTQWMRRQKIRDGI